MQSRADSVRTPEAQRLRQAVARRLRSFRFALRGLAFLVRNEANARIHLGLTVAAIGAGFVLRLGNSDWRWIALAIAIVWVAEALNTAVEQVCNLVSPGPSALVRAAKDVAAGAVLVAAAAAAAIGALTLWPPFEARFFAAAVVAQEVRK